MEEETLAKDEGKKESLEKLEEIEEAYFELMKAYSYCLTILNVRAKKYYYKLSWLTPKIVRYRIGQHVDFLQEVFLSLIVQNKDKNNSEIIKKFELYCEDMNKLSVQVRESGLATRFYDIRGAIAVLIPGIISLLTALDVLWGIIKEKDPVVLLIIYVLISIFILLVLYFIPVSLVWSALKSTRVLIVTGVQDKQDKIFNIIQEYLESV